MPLNLILFERLKNEFGSVGISHEGISAVRNTYRDIYNEQIKTELVTTGEYYKVDCPYCNDTRKRLWINHLWGYTDDITGNKNLWLAICYNEDCLAEPGRREALYDRLFSFQNAFLRDKIKITEGSKDSQKLIEVDYPGHVVTLDRLSPSHKANSFLLCRGYNPYILGTKFQISYCLEAKDNYPQADDRIVIPIYMNNILVGWQCRYIGDLNWKKTRISKYYSMPNMPRSLMLYNYDNAIKFPFVVVCEGPSDVWRVGNFSVASFGKHLSSNQIELLCKSWKGGAIVILMDGDAWDQSLELEKKLVAAKYDGHIISVRLPKDRDPGSLDNDLILDYIVNQCSYKNINLVELERKDDIKEWFEILSHGQFSRPATFAEKP